MMEAAVAGAVLDHFRGAGVRLSFKRAADRIAVLRRVVLYDAVSVVAGQKRHGTRVAGHIHQREPASVLYRKCLTSRMGV